MQISSGRAGFVDKLMDSGTTWDALVAQCKPEAARRGLSRATERLAISSAMPDGVPGTINGTLPR